MAKITDNLKLLSQTKTDIKNAIEQKGQSLENTPFTKYAEKILKIVTGGGSAEDLTDVLNEQDNIITALENIITGSNDAFVTAKNIEYMRVVDAITNGYSLSSYSDYEQAEITFQIKAKQILGVQDV